MPFEESSIPMEKQPDRKLGEEWSDWDGTPNARNTQARPGFFFFICAGVTILIFLFTGWAGLWLVAPRLTAGPGFYLTEWLGAAWAGYLGLWYASLGLSIAGMPGANALLRRLGGIRWIFSPTFFWASRLGISRDRLANAFIQTHNLIENAPLIQDAAKLLVLVPRCLSRDALLRLRSLKEQFGFSQVVAAGGTEARLAISRLRPQGIVAIACERDLLSGVKDLHGRIPILALPNQRPEGPCKNTNVDPEEVEKSLRIFLNAVRRVTGPGKNQKGE